MHGHNQVTTNKIYLNVNKKSLLSFTLVKDVYPSLGINVTVIERVNTFNSLGCI